jgi:hypothetical protein
MLPAVCVQIVITSNIDTQLAHVPEALISFVLKVRGWLLVAVGVLWVVVGVNEVCAGAWVAGCVGGWLAGWVCRDVAGWLAGWVSGWVADCGGVWRWLGGWVARCVGRWMACWVAGCVGVR